MTDNFVFKYDVNNNLKVIIKGSAYSLEALHEIRAKGFLKELYADDETELSSRWQIFLYKTKYE